MVERAVAERPAHDTIERQWRLLYMQTLGRSREVKFLGDGQKKSSGDGVVPCQCDVLRDKSWQSFRLFLGSRVTRVL